MSQTQSASTPAGGSTTPTARRAARVGVQGLAGVPRGRLRSRAPRDTARWKKRAARAIESSLLRARRGPDGGYVAVVSFWGCAWAIARFVAEYGLPIGRVVAVLRSAIKAAGSLKHLRRAYLDGELEKVLGAEGADVVHAFFSAGTLLNDCVSL